MTNSFRKLMREQLQETLCKFDGLTEIPVPNKGWIRAIREALGISSSALAKKLDCSQANIVGIEKREQARSISLDLLDQVAKSMNCKLVYCLVPLNPLDEILENQARTVAKKKVSLINHSMLLENQGLTPMQLKKQVDDLARELVRDNPRKLWRDD